MNYPEGIPDTPLGRYVRLIKPFECREQEGPRKTPKKYSESEKAQAIEMAKAGKSHEEIVDLLSANAWTVRRWLMNAGEWRVTRFKHPAEVRAAIVERLKAGDSLRTIERETGISRHTLREWRRGIE
jgi:transposase-like protein